jgi:hypothetical protein
MGKTFPCDDEGVPTEYIGCKVEQNFEDPSMILTQPVMLQSFEDEFDMSEIRKHQQFPDPHSRRPAMKESYKVMYILRIEQAWANYNT